MCNLLEKKLLFCQSMIYYRVYFDYYLETAILTNIIISESYLKTHDVLYFDWLIDRILFRIPIENIFSHVGTSAFRWRAVILCLFPALTVFYPEGIFYHVISAMTRDLGLYDLIQGTTPFCVKPGVAWEMDSVTNLPPGMILPVTILPPGRNLSVIHLPPPWQVYPLSKKNLCFSHTLILNTFELIWIIIEWFSDRSYFFTCIYERVWTC